MARHAYSQIINSDLLRTVAKFIETQHWREALKILKLAVTRSSTLVAPGSSAAAAAAAFGGGGGGGGSGSLSYQFTGADARSGH